MYQCDNCHGFSKPNEKQNKIVTQVRKKFYYNTSKELEGEGTEIVKENVVCHKCLTDANSGIAYVFRG